MLSLSHEEEEEGQQQGGTKCQAKSAKAGVGAERKWIFLVGLMGEGIVPGLSPQSDPSGSPLPDLCVQRDREG